LADKLPAYQLFFASFLRDNVYFQAVSRVMKSEESNASVNALQARVYE